MKAPLLAATVAGALLLSAAPADATPTGRVHTWQAASRGRTAIHGAVSWQTDANMGSVSVDEWLQHRQRHGFIFHWWTWNRRGPIAEQTTDTGTSGDLATSAACKTGQWRVHVDTTATVIIRGPIVAVVSIHNSHNSGKITVRHC